MSVGACLRKIDDYIKQWVVNMFEKSSNLSNGVISECR